MDPKIQTNFIPRKSAVDSSLPKRAPVGLFTLLSVAVFIVVVATIVLLFLYRQTLIVQNAELEQSLNTYKAKIKQPIVSEVITINRRLEAANNRLNKHVAVSGVFELLSKHTLQDVRWSNFSFEISDTGVATLTMNGQARTFSAVALQMDGISSDKENFKNPLVSDIRLDQNGNPMFTFKSELSEKAVLYSAEPIVLQDNQDNIEQP